MTTPLLALRGIGKTFEATTALLDVTIDIAAGTVHALVGENGAGKSTLGKVIAGVTTADTGVVELDGHAMEFTEPADALRHGITIVAQELALAGTRSVLDNVFLGAEPHRGPFVRRTEMRRRFDELVATSGIEVTPDAIVDELSVADQQKVEILRALAKNARVIVMDEPTARLATHEAQSLMKTFAALRDSGVTIVFVSHFLHEVLAVSDTISVLRDGALVTTRPATAFTHESLVESMIGRTLEATFPDKRVPTSDTEVLAVRGLCRDGVFQDVSFTIGEGEILVITGLVGSGRTEVLRAILGAEPADEGEILLHSRPVRPKRPRQGLDIGFAYIPESRKTEGLLLDSSVADNIALAHLRTLGRAGFVSRTKTAAAADKQIAAIGIKTHSAATPVDLLSGGNQQKVLFGRALLGDATVLMADEPTRGVDVGAKRQIYELIVDHAGRGAAVLLVSSEMEEVIGLAHHVVVMRQGRQAGLLSGSNITEESIARLAFGGLPDASTKELS